MGVVELGKPPQSWIHPKYAGIQTKSMGKVGPNDWSSNQVIFRTILVTHEDKTRNHTDPMRAQTCAILVKIPPSEPMLMMPQMMTQPAADQSDMPLVPTSPLLVILSRIGQLINNTCTHNITFWKLDTLYQHPTSNWPIRHSLISVHQLAHETGNFPFPATILHHLNNLLDADYDTLQYTPAFDIHLPW